MPVGNCNRDELARLLQALDDAGLALLETLVDAGLQHGTVDLQRAETELRSFGFSGARGAVEPLARAGVLRVEGDEIALEPGSRAEVARWLGSHRLGRRVWLGSSAIAWRCLMKGFGSYLQRTGQGALVSAEAEGGLPGGTRFRWKDHQMVILPRLSPALLDLLPAVELLVVTDLPSSERPAAAMMVASRTLLGRVGLYDLKGGSKMCVVRNPLFVLFEWFLRDEYDRRLSPSEEFTRALVQSGLLMLDR